MDDPQNQLGLDAVRVAQGAVQGGKSKTGPHPAGAEGSRRTTPRKPSAPAAPVRRSLSRHPAAPAQPAPGSSARA